MVGCRSSVAERLCVKHAVLGLIPGGNQIFVILYCLKNPVKERGHISKHSLVSDACTVLNCKQP